MYGGCSSVGRALDCGSSCRGFESHQPPHADLCLFFKVESELGRAPKIIQSIAIETDDTQWIKSLGRLGKRIRENVTFLYMA